MELAQYTTPTVNQRPVDWGWDFHTVQGGINPGDIRARPRVVGVVDVCMDSDPGMGGPIVPGWRLYYMYEPWPMSNQARKSHMFLFSPKPRA